MDNKLLIKKHSGGIITLLSIYNTKGDLYKGTFLLIAFAFTVLLVGTVIWLGLETFKVIGSFVELYITIIPSLLGFNLGAYALLIGLGSSSIIEKLSKGFETKFTTFQRASSVFGFCVLLQAVALIIAVVFKQVIILQEADEQPITKVVNSHVIDGLNLTALTVLTFLGTYSIIILIKVIENIFALSQASHFFTISESLKRDKLLSDKRNKKILKKNKKKEEHEQKPDNLL